MREEDQGGGGQVSFLCILVLRGWSRYLCSASVLFFSPSKGKINPGIA